jgi:transcriptional regulator GlxA family with amidase domain
MRVAILVYPEVTLLDATGPAQVFASARDIAGRDRAPYEVLLVSKDGGSIVTDTGIALGTVSLAAAATGTIDTLLVAGGLGVFDAAADAELTAWVHKWSRRSRRTGSTCMGAFLTAAAGLLAGRRVATHWRWCDRLQQAHPDIVVEPDPIFVRDGALWSSAGVTAGIDMALAMVEEDVGLALALEVARSLVVFLKRPGGQSQFSAALTAQSRDADGDFAALHAWISNNLAADLRVECLAERAGMSPRTFARTYMARLGATPAKTVEAIRVEAARRLLEQAECSIAIAARRSGFRSLERMRRAFLRHLGVSPSEYRDRFCIPKER